MHFLSAAMNSFGASISEEKYLYSMIGPILEREKSEQFHRSINVIL